MMLMYLRRNCSKYETNVKAGIPEKLLILQHYEQCTDENTTTFVIIILKDIHIGQIEN